MVKKREPLITGRTEVRGEIVMYKSDFAKLNDSPKKRVNRYLPTHAILLPARSASSIQIGRQPTATLSGL